MTQNPYSANILIVDDICDSGETFNELLFEYPHSKFACLHFKPHTSCFKPEFSANNFFLNNWIIYPWEQKDSKTIQDYKL
jgi:hypoxanthine phosphoribosyltransferase